MKPLKLAVWRKWLFANESIGKLYLNGIFTGIYTLEDQIRPTGEKVYGQTAIPYGKYPVEITFSPKFGTDMPLIENVPGFAGIRIHTGQSNRDTAGCLLVGTDVKGTKLTGSEKAFNYLFSILQKAQNEGRKIFIEFLSTESWLINRALILLSIILLAIIIALVYLKYFRT